jgi:hypothetical protein
MINKKRNKQKVPLIYTSKESQKSFTIFNPNYFKGTSRLIIQSCAAQYSLLSYSLEQIQNLFSRAETQCFPFLIELNNQYKNKKFLYKDICYFVEVPEVHLYIQVFLVSVKVFLDLFIQLISTERIVNIYIDGFHKYGDIIGGRVLNILKHNSIYSKKKVSKMIIKLVEKNKKEWIDNVIIARDNLTHPKKGVTQIMYEVKIRRHLGNLEIKRIKKPRIETDRFDTYGKKIMINLKKFSEDLIKLVA